jgi:hypothetical protein
VPDARELESVSARGAGGGRLKSFEARPFHPSVPSVFFFVFSASDFFGLVFGAGESGWECQIRGKNEVSPLPRALFVLWDQDCSALPWASPFGLRAFALRDKSFLTICSNRIADWELRGVRIATGVLKGRADLDARFE